MEPIIEFLYHKATLSFLHVSEGVMIEGFKVNLGTVLLGKIKNEITKLCKPFCRCGRVVKASDSKSDSH